VLQQTRTPQEIVCVDDGSTDDTLAILRDIKESGADIRIQSQENKGASAARNAGLDTCAADYVCFLDADDLLHPEKLEHQARLAAERSPRPDLIAGASKNVYVDEPERPDKVDVPHPDKWVALIRSSLGTTCSNLWRVSAVQAVGGWNEDVAQGDDAELMFRMLCNGASVLRDSKVLTTLRRRSNSLSNRSQANTARAMLEIRKSIYCHLKLNGQLNEERRGALASMSFHSLRSVVEQDPAFAQRMGEELLPASYSPGLGRVYDTLYSAFGIYFAEKFYDIYSNVKDKISNLDNIL